MNVPWPAAMEAVTVIAGDIKTQCRETGTATTVSPNLGHFTVDQVCSIAEIACMKPVVVFLVWCSCGISVPAQDLPAPGTLSSHPVQPFAVVQAPASLLSFTSPVLGAVVSRYADNDLPVTASLALALPLWVGLAAGISYRQTTFEDFADRRLQLMLARKLSAGYQIAIVAGYDQLRFFGGERRRRWSAAFDQHCSWKSWRFQVFGGVESGPANLSWSFVDAGAGTDLTDALYLDVKGHWRPGRPFSFSASLQYFWLTSWFLALRVQQLPFCLWYETGYRFQRLFVLTGAQWKNALGWEPMLKLVWQLKPTTPDHD